MKDKILENVYCEQDGTCWKTLKIKKLNKNGLCALCKDEKILDGDLYYFDREVHILLENQKVEFPRVVLLHYSFKDISTKPGTKIKVECEKIKSSNKFKVKEPLNIKLK